MDYSKIYDNLRASFKKSFRKTGAKKAVIGISGGLDSAVAAAIAVKSIGSGKVSGIYMPCSTSSESSYDDALALSASIGLQLDIVKIATVVDAYFMLTWDEISDVRKGNIMSRIRMTTLFDKSAACEGIVIGTANRTEILLGYGTWHGDTASSINILGNLYKREVREIGKLANIPESILTKTPSADLWQGQTDEGELGFSYDVIDDFLYDLEQEKLTKSELIKKFGAETTESLLNRVIKNSFKRNLPVVCSTGLKERKKISEKAILRAAKN